MKMAFARLKARLVFICVFATIEVVAADIELSDSISACSPFLQYANGSNSPVTIGVYLDNLPCQQRFISRELKDLFRDTTESAVLREDLRGSLGNVCALFVDVMSFLAQNSQLSSVYICDPIDRPLSNVAVAIWDFCDKILETLPSGDRIAALVSSELDRFEFTAHSRELSKLINLRRDCSVKCGDGNGRIMCSAYYSAVDLLVNMRSIMDITGPPSTSSPVTQPRTTPSASFSLPPSTSSPVTHPTTPQSALSRHPPPIELNSSEPTSRQTLTAATEPARSSVKPSFPTVPPNTMISHLARHLLSLSEEELLMLCYIPRERRYQVLRNVLVDFPARELSQFVSLSDSGTLLRMFWVVRVAFVELRERWGYKIESCRSSYLPFQYAGNRATAERVREVLAGFTDWDDIKCSIDFYSDILFAHSRSGGGGIEGEFPGELEQQLKPYTKPPTMPPTAEVDEGKNSFRHHNNWTAYAAENDYRYYHYRGTWGTQATSHYYYADGHDREWYMESYRKYDHRRLVLKAVRITFAVLGSLFAAVVAAICLVLLVCCCVHKWDKICQVICCKQRQVKYYKLSTTEDI